MIFTANSISTGHPNAFLPTDKISSASLSKDILPHFKIGEKETILVPGYKRESLMVPSSFEIELPNRFLHFINSISAIYE